MRSEGAGNDEGGRRGGKRLTIKKSFKAVFARPYYNRRMMSSQYSNPHFEPHYAAARLRISVRTLLKLRRLLDPDLTFDEHRKIVPVDLGPIWDRAAFSATKSKISEETSLGLREAEKTQDRTTIDMWTNKLKIEKRKINREFLPIRKQFLDIFYFGFMAQCQDYSRSFDFTPQQSTVPAGQSQRDTGFHLDRATSNWKVTFKESWIPPASIVLIARDVGPSTLCIKGLEEIPWQAVNWQGAYKDDALAEVAAEKGQLRVLRPGRVYAIDDRVLHAGQKSRRRQKRTFSRAISTIRRQNFLQHHM